MASRGRRIHIYIYIYIYIYSVAILAQDGFFSFGCPQLTPPSCFLSFLLVLYRFGLYFGTVESDYKFVVFGGFYVGWQVVEMQAMRLLQPEGKHDLLLWEFPRLRWCSPSSRSCWGRAEPKARASKAPTMATTMGKGKARSNQGLLVNLVPLALHNHRGVRIATQKSLPPSEDGSEAPQSELQERMQTLQAVLNSIKGRNDPYAEDLRTMSQSQMAKLRVEAHESKSLPQQISIMQQVVDRKEVAFAEAKQKMDQCMTNLEVAREKCMAADAARTECKDKLQGLISRCATEVPASQPQEVSDHQLAALGHLGALLPAELSKGFQEALAHIQGLLKPDVIDVDVARTELVIAGSVGSFGSPGGSAAASSGAVLSGLGDASSISSLSVGANSGIVLPSGWGRGRGRQAAHTTVPSGTDKRSRSKGENCMDRSESLDSGSRRRIRGKQPNPFGRTPSAGPSDSRLPVTGARYFSQEALASEHGA